MKLSVAPLLLITLLAGVSNVTWSDSADSVILETMDLMPEGVAERAMGKP
ncbi:MAG TPA: hypothetical protein VKO38_05800 [Wenzhouxiangella sp.]|nr:hypothetical protein [Wenzhouxiangella sp.]